MLRTVQSLPLAGLSTLGFDPARFQTEPPVCYRPPGSYPDRTSTGKRRRARTRTRRSPRHLTRSPPVLLGARKPRVNGVAGLRGAGRYLPEHQLRRFRRWEVGGNCITSSRTITQIAVDYGRDIDA